jgi:hypothetical protein
VNLCWHSSFAIDLTFAIASLPAIRAFGVGLSAWIWWNDQCNVPVSGIVTALRSVFVPAYIVGLMTVSALIVSGWCIYCPTFPLTRFLEILFSSQMTVIAWRSFNSRGDAGIEEALILMLLVVIGLLWFAKLVLTSLFTFVKLCCSEPELSAGFSQRLLLIWRFLFLLAGVISATLVMTFCVYTLRVWTRFSPWVLESAAAALHAGQFVIFSLSKAYEGDGGDDDALPGTAFPRMLAAPGSDELVLVAPDL